MKNRVAHRVTVRSHFTADELRTLPVRRRRLIVCDCEGGETDIFTPQTGRKFAAWDLLIETHDFLDITISTRLAGLFRDTHDLARSPASTIFRRPSPTSTRNSTRSISRRAAHSGRVSPHDHGMAVPHRTPVK